MDREAEPFALASVPEAVAALRAPRPADAARLMEDWLSALTARTRATYRRSLGNVARLVGLSDQAALAACILGAADPVTVRAMGLRFRDLRAREVGAATVNNEMAALGSLYSFLTGRPLVGLKRLRVAADQQARREGPAAIAAVVRAAAAQPGLKGARDAAILAMLADGGLRRAELLSLDVGHVEAEGPEAPRVMSTLKGHGAARVGRPLSSAAAQAVAAWLAARGSPASGPLFTSLDRSGTHTGGRLSGEGLRKMVRKVSRVAGLATPLRPHDLRRCGAANLARAGASMAAIAAWGRWQDPRTANRYVGRADDLARQAAAQLAALRTEVV